MSQFTEKVPLTDGGHAAEKYGQLVIHREDHLAPACRRYVHS